MDSKKRKSNFPGLGSGKIPPKPGTAPAIEARQRVEVATFICGAMIRSEDWDYVNHGDVFGEERYAVDAMIAADEIIALSKKRPEDVKKRYRELCDSVDKYEGNKNK